jgi:hypothetical protein
VAGFTEKEIRARWNHTTSSEKAEGFSFLEWLDES